MKISVREMPSTRVLDFQIWNDELVGFKKKLGLCLGRKNEIVIPKIFLSEERLTKSVLRGIFDTDGGIYLEKKNKKLYPRMYITTISCGLSNKLLYALKKLGFRATVYLNSDKRNSKRFVLHSVNIRGIEMFHKFMKEINPQNPKRQEKYKRFILSQNL